MTTYIAMVTGKSWGGFRASTEYTFYSKPTRTQVLDASGDFETVTRILLIKRTITNTVEKLAAI